MLTPRQLLIAVLVIGGAAIGGALLFQYVGGLEPCELCLLERWPYYAGIPIAVLALATGMRGAGWWIALLFLVFLVSAGLGGYHVGVEHGWLQGPTACTGPAGGGAKTAEEFARMIEERQAVQCDQVPWSLMGISLAGFNFLVSLLLVLLCASGFGHLLRERAA